MILAIVTSWCNGKPFNALKIDIGCGTIDTFYVQVGVRGNRIDPKDCTDFEAMCATDDVEVLLQRLFKQLEFSILRYHGDRFNGAWLSTTALYKILKNDNTHATNFKIECVLRLSSEVQGCCLCGCCDCCDCCDPCASGVWCRVNHQCSSHELSDGTQ